MGDIVLEVNALKKKYNKNADFTIKGVSFKIEAGEIVGMVGRNGAGKSTTIKSITGLIPFEEGEIKICGYNIDSEPIEAKKRFGYVPDVSMAFDKMTGMEYLNFIGDIYKVDKVKREAQIKELDDCFKLNEALGRLISSYSHGMKQKISVMASLLFEPKLWILDEPLTGLDPQTSSGLKKYMLSYAKKGNTVLFSSHNLDVVEKICTRVLFINKGELVEDLKMGEFAKKGEALEDYFINLCEGEDDE